MQTDKIVKLIPNVTQPSLSGSDVSLELNDCAMMTLDELMEWNALAIERNSTD